VSTGDDPYAERKKLSFEEAEGVEPVPAQLKLKEISPRLRAALWRVVHDSLREARIWMDYARAASLKSPWVDILRDMYTYRYHRMTFTNHADPLIDEVQAIFADGDYVAIFGWLQWVLRRRDRPYRFSENRQCSPIWSSGISSS
jgi:hypothetical protein